jgi:hypothetical protein
VDAISHCPEICYQKPTQLVPETLSLSAEAYDNLLSDTAWGMRRYHQHVSQQLTMNAKKAAQNGTAFLKVSAKRLFTLSFDQALFLNLVSSLTDTITHVIHTSTHSDGLTVDLDLLD